MEDLGGKTVKGYQLQERLAEAADLGRIFESIETYTHPLCVSPVRF